MNLRRLRLPCLTLSLACLLSPTAQALSAVVVTTPNDAGAGSLRQAIVDANANRDLTAIQFDIDKNSFGPGPWTIPLQSELPEFTAPVRLLGFSQRGALVRTSPLDSEYRIEIDDSAVVRTTDNMGATLSFAPGSMGSVVSGLAFVGTASGQRDAAAILVVADDVSVQGNRFGIGADGRLSRYDGIPIGTACANRAKIGGDLPSQGNLIGGSTRDAIMITGGRHLIANNWIGFEVTGASYHHSNFVDGAGIRSGSIGWGAPRRYSRTCSASVQQEFWGLRQSTIRANYISATRFAAIVLAGGATTFTEFNEISGNSLGDDLWLNGNSHVDIGVQLTRGARNNTVRDNLVGLAYIGIALGEDSTTAPNDAGAGNLLSGNRFREVWEHGIGLDGGQRFAPLANDPGDGDRGANERQNKPELTSVDGDWVQGRLESVPGRVYRVEFFHSASCEDVAYFCLEHFLGATLIGTDGNGAGHFDVRFQDLIGATLPTAGLRTGDRLYATATDVLTNNTSELSDVARVRAPAATAITVTALPTPIAAMTGPASITIDVGSSSAHPPTGEVVLTLITATGRRPLGRATLNQGTATIWAPTETGSFFPQAGHFDIEAYYLGDASHQQSASALQTVIVFRPAAALRSVELSSPLRRHLATGALERFDIALQQFVPLLSRPSASVIDSERLQTFPLDLTLINDSGQWQTLDGAGGVTSVASSLIPSGFAVIDLIQADTDAHADALVQDPATREYGIVINAFTVEGNVRRFVSLPRGPEREYATSGDFNGDGMSDLVFRETSNGAAVILSLVDAQVISATTLARTGNQQPVTAADLNGDGYEDLIWLDGARGDVTASIMKEGNPIRTAIATLPPGMWSTPGSGHFALRGSADFGLGHVVFFNAVKGEAVVWRHPRLIGGALTVVPDTLFIDLAYGVERLR